MITIYRTKLILRIMLLIAALQLYIRDKGSLIFANGRFLSQSIQPIYIIWIIFMAGMIPKFFPQKGNSMGCRKQFRSAFEPSNQRFARSEMESWFQYENKAARKVLALWFGANGVIVFFYHLKIIGQSELVLLSLFYLVCDMVCILFWCPFQDLIMKNRCCITCRIFNWDSIMACTPLLFVPSLFSWSLVSIALVLLLRWEYSYWKHPWRFFEGSNARLQCKYCNEKICRTKKTLHVRPIHSRYI